MSQPSRTAKLAALAAAVLLPMTLIACGETTGPPVSAAPGAGGSSEDAPEGGGTPSASPTASGPAEAGSAEGAFGPACGTLPRSGPGSPDEMAREKVGEAVAANPELSTLAGLVQAAGLVETLDEAEDVTVFAPSNDAFSKVDPTTLGRATVDPKGLLAAVLSAHVVEGRLAPDQLAGEHETLNAKEPVTVTGSGESFTVNESARVVCGNVQTANATVYIIDQVLLPSS